MAAARRRKAEEARRITLAHGGGGGLGTAAFESISHRGARAAVSRGCGLRAVTGPEACATVREYATIFMYTPWHTLTRTTCPEIV